MSQVDLWAYERACWEEGATLVCGVDEAGRGPLAGPVCAAAVILPRDLDLEAALPGLNDSKKLTDQKRRELYGRIQDCALAWHIALASQEEIDAVNILQATFLAMGRAVAGLGSRPEWALKGDSLSASIAAASILAKVYRDDIMLEMAERYPQYGFEVHKGYGTKRHYAALEEFGPCPIHRQSFLKKFYAGK